MWRRGFLGPQLPPKASGSPRHRGTRWTGLYAPPRRVDRSTMDRRMICIGAGPGPKNVLVEYEDGFRTAVPYAVWKHKLSRPSGGQLSDTTYASVAGFIQFDPVTRDANGKEVTDVTVKAIGSQKLVKVTIWPDFDFEGEEVTKGDFIA